MSAEAQVPTRPDDPVVPRRRIVMVFAGLMLGLLLSELNETIFATALPSVVGELRGMDHMLWVTTAYILAGTIVMPIYGKLGDLVGRKPLFVLALSIFIVGSVIGGLAPNMGVLITGRAVQGLGGGGLLILIQAIIADLVPARERPRYLSAMGAVFAVSSALGPVLGGWLTAGVGWRWAFWINLPLGAVAIASALVFLRPPARRPEDIKVVVDVWGITTMATGVTAIVLLTAWGGTRYDWTSPVVLTLVVIAIVATAAFILVEQRTPEPLISLRLFRHRNFTLATVSGLVMAVAMFGTIAYLPTYLQMVTGLTPTMSGLMMLTLIGGLGLATVGSAQVVTRTGRYKWLPVIGSALVAIALALLSTLTVTTDLRLLGGYLFVLGAGIGTGLQLLLLIVQNTVDQAQVGTATAANDFFREIGVAVGSAVVGTLFTHRLGVLLGQRIPPDAPDIDVRGLTPESVAQLPEALRAAVGSAYNDALTPVFGYLVPLMILSTVGLALIKHEPLATTVEGEPT
ncbi:MAG TPA: MDR family MFS transporter [Propionibacteriaceae bacterium]